MFLLKNERITKGDLRDSFLEGRKIEKIAGFPPHNGQKKNKLSTLHMCLIKIGFLKFKQPKHSISGKNPANNYMNFFYAMLFIYLCYKKAQKQRESSLHW